MAESLVGMIKEMAGQSGGGILTCSVLRTNPLQLQFQGDTSVVLTKESLIVPAHVSLVKGNTAYVMKNGENSFFVLGKG